MVKATIDCKGRALTETAPKRKGCEKNTEVYSPPRIAMYGKQLRKFGESLLQQGAVSNGLQPQEAALLFSKSFVKGA